MQTQDKDKTKEETQEKPKARINKIPDWPIGLSLPNRERLTVSVAQDLAVVLTKDAFEQLFGWAYSTSREISCLGSVHRNGNRFFIDGFYLLKQSGSSACTELDQDAIGELMEQMMSEGKTNETQSIKCWAHSHPNMEAFWSKVDDSTCQLLVNDYLISIVVGSNFAIRCRIDIAAPLPITLDNVPVFYQMSKESLTLDLYAEQVGQMVSEKAFSFETEDNKRKQEQDKRPTVYSPPTYCGYCGYVHADDECPLADSENWQNIDDDDFMF
jgi:proteasome lid subunit RPN8/RPN11